MKIELLSRGRFEPLPSARATPAGPNAWTLEIPLDDPGVRRARLGGAIEDWDARVFALDGVETEPAVGTGASGREVVVTVYVLD